MTAGNKCKEGAEMSTKNAKHTTGRKFTPLTPFLVSTVIWTLASGSSAVGQQATESTAAATPDSTSSRTDVANTAETARDSKVAGEPATPPRPARFIHYVSHGQRAMPVFTTLMEELGKKNVGLSVGHPGEPPADQLRIEVTIEETSDWKEPVAELLKEISELPIRPPALSCGPTPFPGKGQTGIALRWRAQSPSVELKAEVKAVQEVLNRQSRVPVSIGPVVELAAAAAKAAPVTVGSPARMTIAGDGGATFDADKEKIKKLISEGILQQVDDIYSRDAANVMFHPNVDDPALIHRPELTESPINPKWDDALRELSKRSVENEIRIRFIDANNLGFLASFSRKKDATVHVPVDSTHKVADTITSAFEKVGLAVTAQQIHPFFGAQFIPKGKELFPVYANEAGSPSAIVQSTEDVVDVRLILEDGSGLRQTFGKHPALLERAKIQTYRNAPKDAGGQRVVGVLVTPEEARLLRAAEREGRLEALRRDPDDKTTDMSPELRSQLTALLLPGEKPMSPQASSPPDARRIENVKIVQLQNSQARALSSLLAQVVRADGFTAVPDERTNSIVITSPDADSLTMAEALLAKLDEPSPARSLDPLAKPPGGKGGQTAEPLADLQQGYAQREAQAAALAADLRRLAEPPADDPEIARLSSAAFFNEVDRDERKFVDAVHKAYLGRPAKDEELKYWVSHLVGLGYNRPRFLREFVAAIRPGRSGSGKQAANPKEAELRQKLTAAVRDAFAARQALLVSELDALHSKIADSQRSLELRNKIADEIIARRVEDLLRPELNWNESPTAPPAVSTSPGASQPAPSGFAAPGTLTPAVERVAELPARGTGSGGEQIEPARPRPPSSGVRKPSAVGRGPSNGLEGRESTPEDIIAMLTGIWETTLEPGMMGSMGMGMGAAGMMPGAAAPSRLIIYGDRAALYERNEQKRLWAIEVESSQANLARIHFKPLDSQAGMQGACLIRERQLTVVSTGEDGAQIVRYRRAVSAVPPDWVKRMQTAGKTDPALSGTPRRSPPPGRPADSPEAELFSNLDGIWSSRTRMEAYGEMGMGFAADAAVDPAMAGSQQTTFLVMHAGRAALYERNEQKQSWSIAIEQLDETQARLNFIPADARSGMQGSYVLKKGVLTVVSSGEEGPTIEYYSRVVPIVPPEWASAMEQGIPERRQENSELVPFPRPEFTNPGVADPPAKPGPELLRGIESGTARQRPQQGADPGRNPSDYLELVRPYADILGERDRLLQSVGQDHPKMRARMAEFTRAEKAIELLQKELHSELKSAESQVKLRRAELDSAGAALARARSLFKANATTESDIQAKEGGLKIAEARLEAAELRLRLLESTFGDIFPPASSAESTPPGSSPDIPSPADPPPSAPLSATAPEATPTPAVPPASPAPAPPIAPSTSKAP